MDVLRDTEMNRWELKIRCKLMNGDLHLEGAWVKTQGSQGAPTDPQEMVLRTYIVVRTDGWQEIHPTTITNHPIYYSVPLLAHWDRQPGGHENDYILSLSPGSFSTTRSAFKFGLPQVVETSRNWTAWHLLSDWCFLIIPSVWIASAPWSPLWLPLEIR